MFKRLITVVVICLLGLGGSTLSVNATEKMVNTRQYTIHIVEEKTEGTTRKKTENDTKKQEIFYYASLAFLTITFILKKVEDYK